MARKAAQREPPRATVLKPRYPGQRREGRGFSLAELRLAGLTLKQARKLGLRLDPRRRTAHEENVKELKALLAPRRRRPRAPKPKAARRRARRGEGKE
ncbi:MAG: 50S ribosomal protein L13e [Nitrososphaerota archaeon]